MNRKSRWIGLAGMGYVVLVVAVVATGVLAYGEVYSAPAPQPGTEFAPSYRVFLTVSGGLLALCLGAVAAALGAVSGRWWLGAFTMLAGLAVTAVALSLMPWVRFPYDQYAPGALWVFTWAPASAGLWLLASAAGRAVRFWRAVRT